MNHRWTTVLILIISCRAVPSRALHSILFIYFISLRVMSLWLDKHRPQSLAKLTIHSDLTGKLTALARTEELPHLMFYGPPGAGKKTRVRALLREIYGSGADKTKLEHRSFKTPTNRLVEVTTLGSNYHIECNPSDAGNQDRFVIQEVIKEIASHSNLQSGSGGSSSRSFKIGLYLLLICFANQNDRHDIAVVLTEVDRLSKQAQAGLRRTMEK
jgi:replication factor C subunit 3/5